jgi:hypothetical protein
MPSNKKAALLIAEDQLNNIYKILVILFAAKNRNEINKEWNREYIIGHQLLT